MILTARLIRFSLFLTCFFFPPLILTVLLLFSIAVFPLLSPPMKNREYSLCFLIYGQQHVLVLNRVKAPWMGCWNGVGGKLQDSDESPLHCAFREVEEETGYTPDTYCVKATGQLQWSEVEQPQGVLHLFLMELKDPPKMGCPIMTREGILDWKSTEWLLHTSNVGVVSNMRQILPALMKATSPVAFFCGYDADGHLTKMIQLH